jgi:hypothetical protein
MTRIPGRRGRLPAFALLLALLASMLPATTVLGAAVNPATGGTAISADQFGTSNFTPLSGPAIQTTLLNEIAAGTTTILNVPAGFRFNPGVGNVSVSGGCPLTGGLVVTATQATFTSTAASGAAGCVLTFVGLQVQPTAGPGLVTGTITKTGTSAGTIPSPGNYGTLTKVAGAVTELIVVTQPSANNNGGTNFGTQPVFLARDQFGNAAANVPVTLGITPGTGAAGAALTCTNNPQTTNGAGGALFAGCKIDLAGSYRLRATSGTGQVDTGLFNVNVGPAVKIIFTGYPNATTAPLLNPQPRVAFADAGNNVVTTFPNSNITIAVNKNGGTFSCTGGLTAQSVSGVATFNGCTQTTPDTGYQLSASFMALNIIGPAFAVTPPTLAFVAGPGSPVNAGQPFPTSIQVAIQNGGTTITSGVSATVTLAIGTNPSGGTLTCPGGTAVGTINGVATFPGCSINNPGTGYTLTATASNVVPMQPISGAVSSFFDIFTANTASIALTTFCGQPDPIDLTGPGTCAPDTTKSPPQTNIELPQTLDEGVRLVAAMGVTGANRQISFEVSKDQVTWGVVNTTTTDANGNASFFYRPSDNRYYRATFAGAPDLGAATSPIVRVVVRSLIFLRPTGCTDSTDPCVKNDGTSTTFVATARPNRPELPTQQVRFVLQRRSGSTWVTTVEQTVTVSKATGTASLIVSWSTTGTFRIRANLTPTSVNANSFPTPFEYYRIQ